MTVIVGPWEGSEDVPWWCVRGTMVVVVNAQTEDMARAVARRWLRRRGGLTGTAAQVKVRPATEHDVALWRELCRQQEAGVAGARIQTGPVEHACQDALF